MGFVVDRVGRKAAMTITTLFIVIGGILGTVAHAPSAVGFFWFITVARGMVGYGAGGEYPAASTAVRHSSSIRYLYLFHSLSKEQRLLSKSTEAFSS